MYLEVQKTETIRDPGSFRLKFRNSSRYDNQMHKVHYIEIHFAYTVIRGWTKRNFSTLDRTFDIAIDVPRRLSDDRWFILFQKFERS